jgi:hypothetical protein
MLSNLITVVISQLLELTVFASVILHVKLQHALPFVVAIMFGVRLQVMVGCECGAPRQCVWTYAAVGKGTH